MTFLFPFHGYELMSLRVKTDKHLFPIGNGFLFYLNQLIILSTVYIICIGLYVPPCIKRYTFIEYIYNGYFARL